ncbi:MAG TPA: hypothetical protein VK129_06530 [Terriglobales bacterium]|nr:hypothetical protein [Terriglobales bacterium]
MQKAPDYERIQQTLRSGEECLNGDEEVWVQKYLDLADRLLKPGVPLLLKTPLASRR